MRKPSMKSKNLLRHVYRTVLSSKYWQKIGRKRIIWRSKFSVTKRNIAPVFIIGCPRSGTTLLGWILSIHPEICYLNEPKWLWGELYPPWDSYGAVSDPAQAAIRLDARDLDSKTVLRIRNALSYIRQLSGKENLVEKTPDNSARVEWLRKIFSDAKFIHILRCPHDTAISLEKALELWFPTGWINSAQYSVWERHCSTEESLSQLWAETQNDFERGLIIWRELNRMALEDAALLGFSNYIKLKYEDLVNEPVQCVNKLKNFIGVSYSDELLGEIRQHVKVDSVGKSNYDEDKIIHFVGAPLLRKLGYANS